MTMNPTNKTRDMVLHMLNRHLSTKVSDFSFNEHSDVSFSSLGLDSADHVELTGVIEDYLQVKVEPTLAFDYPTINALVDFLDENFITVTQLTFEGPIP
jgi:acyl carrier protein